MNAPTNAGVRRHVIKVGGSLLSRPDARQAITNTMDALRRRAEDTHFVLLVGGGEPVEWLRRVDRQNPVGGEAAHWAAVAMMDANAVAVSGWLPDAELVDDAWGWSDRTREPGATLLKTSRFLREKEPKLPGKQLPHGWNVTSDSIAARLAVALDASLTLLKSRPFSTPATIDGWRRLAAEHAVDGFFPELVGKLRSVTLASPAS